ncbi:CgeB family protein [Alteromonas sp. A079]|uniref:CgeB family protein n=1 Tax=Alteromonas sp. A079 TaxID=3410268 RepID=UPI003BA26F47
MLKKHLRSISSLVIKKDQASLNKMKAKLLASRCFDEDWYKRSYPSVMKKRRWKNSPIDHFLEKGLEEQTSPGIWFDSKWYLNQNEDVAKAGINPLIHYLHHGHNEGRYRSSKSLFNPIVSENQFIRLDEEGITFQCPVIGDSYEFNVSLLYQQYQDAKLNKPCGILLVNCFDNEGKSVNKNVKGLKWSEMYNCWYRYLTQHSTDELKTDKFTFEVPNNTVSITTRVSSWASSSLEIRNSFRFCTPQFSSLRKLPTRSLSEKPNKALKRAGELKVAFIADEFTYNSFKSEFQPIIVEPNNWKDRFNSEKPDVFFCESAWSGVDSVKRPWKGKVYASKNFAKENRLELLSILEYCRKNNIPSIFWNKEDPTHYTDRTHDFVKTAREFDFVFTSAEECVEKYKKDLGLKNVFALPFATNPNLFNPLQTESRSNKVVFAGSWYANHEERSRVMEQVLDSLIAAGYEPEIYDRYFGGGDPLHEWPDKYKAFTKAGLPHDNMPQVYKSSVLGLNFNTVTDSSTMFARRVFELMSSNTLVISNYAKGVDEMFGGLVVFADKEPDKLQMLTENDIDSLREAALTKVLKEHTYKQRWKYVLDCIDYEVLPSEESVTLSCLVNSEEEALRAISQYEESFGRNKSCSLLLVVSERISDLEVSEFYKKFNRFGVSVTCSSYLSRYAQSSDFSLIQSDFFVLYNLENMPEREWVEHAILHSSYMESHPVSKAPRNTKYRLIDSSNFKAIVGQAQMFLDVYSAFYNGTTVRVYEV